MSLQLHAVSDNVEQTNFRHLVLDIAWFALAQAATSRFLSIYAIHLGASAAQLGWINAAPALVLLMSSSFGGWWRSRHTDSVKALFLPGLAFRLVFLLPAFAPFFPAALQPWWIVLAVTLPAVPQGPANIAFMSLVREAVKDNRLPPLFNRRSLAYNIALAVSAVAFGLWLEQAPFPMNYQAMFVLAFVFALVSFRHCTKIRAIAPSIEAASVPRVNPWQSPAFRQVALVAALIHIGFTSILAITPLHLVQNLNASEGFMALFGLVELSAGAAVAIFTPRLIHRYGMRGMIALSMMGTGVAAVIFALAHSLPITLIAAALSGACWTAAAMVGLNAFFNQNAPADQMTRYSTAFQQVIGFSAFVGPLIGSALAGSNLPLATVLMVGAVLRVIAGILTEHHLFARWMHLPQREPARAKVP